MPKPIVWTIAGSDSGGGAGIQADLHTFQDLGVHGCSVIAALTAQNSKSVHQIEFVAASMITAQIKALAEDMPAKVIKLGMLGSQAALQAILPMLDQFAVPIICDPVLFASAGSSLHEGDIRQYLIKHLLPRVTVLTPNVPEAEWLLDRKLHSNSEIEQAAHELLTLGPKSILIKGGHATSQGNYCQDYWTDGKQDAWLTNKRLDTPHRHGSGCTLASAIAACLAQNYPLNDALIIAKAYVNQGMRLSGPIGQGPGPIAHAGWPESQIDFPWTHNPLHRAFPSCGPEPLGFYPIVENAKWVERLLQQGVKTLQLRIKNSSDLEEELKTSITLAQNYKARLFINDHWKLAIKLGAYGVHLGQDDLDQVDFNELLNAGLRLGISTHCYSEIARAHAYRPSYIAIGPIYPTNTKTVNFPPQGLEQLSRYCRTLDYPLVAIGGIHLERLPDVLQTGVDGVAVISAITQAKNPDIETQKWVEFCNHGKIRELS